jgi:hypothetical protein
MGCIYALLLDVPRTMEVCQKNAVPPSEGKDGDTSPVDDWNETAECVLGNIPPRLHHTITYQFADYISPSALWAKLLEKYRVPGLSKNYINFKAIMDLRIPNNSDPSPFFDQLAALFLHLKQNNLEIPKKLRVIIILAKMPPAYKAMVQMCVIAGEDADQDLEQLMTRF